MHSQCCFGCNATENPYHIFVDCQRYSEMQRKEAKVIENKVLQRMVESCNHYGIMNTVKSLFSDSSSVWPLHSLVYYLGQIPKLEPLLSVLSMASRVNHTRLIHNIATDMHMAAVCLASRIYRDLQQEMAKRHDERQ